MSSIIQSVWKKNFSEEIIKVAETMNRFRVITFDTEFPGFVRNTPRHGAEKDRYGDMKFNVDRMRAFQFGFTLSNEAGVIGGAWEFNLNSFDPDTDLYAQDSLEFLKNAGFDFARLKTEGIESSVFRRHLSEIIRRHHRGLTWVTFHGMYDFGYLLKLLFEVTMPSTSDEFTGLLGRVFGGRVFDVKYMATVTGFGDIGLERLANRLKVTRVGGAHQAGSDSLLTAMVFSKMTSTLAMNMRLIEGTLQGISIKIVVRPPPPPPTVYFPVQVPPMYYRPQPVPIRMVPYGWVSC